MICLAKSISGNGLPMALLLIKPEFDQWSPGEHNGTFRGNNLAFVSATTALQFWRDPRFVAAIESTAARIHAWMHDMTAEIGATRVVPKGRGLMSGLAFAEEGVAECVAAEAFQRQVLIETAGPRDEVLKLLPPLTIERDVLEEGLARLRAAVLNVVRQDSFRPAA